MTVKEFFETFNYEGQFLIKGKYEYKDSTIYSFCINEEVLNWTVVELSVEDNVLIMNCI